MSILYNKKVAVAMSGGIDSAVAALLIKNQGFDTHGVTMKLCERILPDGTDASLTDIGDARNICEKLGIEHTVYELSRDFYDAVIRDFIDTYMHGATPNPCIVCNKLLKFGKLLDIERENGTNYIATGHYARIEKHDDGRYLLKKSADAKKDQTYMLWSLSQEQLAHTLFPLGSLTKAEIREIGAKHGFVNAHKSDSQDICFIPDGDYASFIEKKLGQKYPSGDYIDEDGNIIGKHKGMIHYTIGQRKGLGISMNRHIFVIDKDFKSNTVTLADEDKLFKSKVIIKNINLIPFDRLDGKIKIEAKIRYSQSQSPAFAEQTGGDEITLTFDTPQRAPARGQSAVMYDGDTVIGGGIIQ